MARAISQAADPLFLFIARLYFADDHEPQSL
jgi:hypothetical protein